MYVHELVIGLVQNKIEKHVYFYSIKQVLQEHEKNKIATTL
jgi:hypothetical protein